MDPVLLRLGREALVLSLLVSAPPLGAALGVGLLVGTAQAATQVQDPSIPVVPRLLAVVGALVVTAPWIGAHAVRFAEACLAAAAQVAP
jgi:type III secretory pathway component EscS